MRRGTLKKKKKKREEDFLDPAQQVRWAQKPVGKRGVRHTHSEVRSGRVRGSIDTYNGS